MKKWRVLLGIQDPETGLTEMYGHLDIEEAEGLLSEWEKKLFGEE